MDQVWTPENESTTYRAYTTASVPDAYVSFIERRAFIERAAITELKAFHAITRRPPRTSEVRWRRSGQGSFTRSVEIGLSSR